MKLNLQQGVEVEETEITVRCKAVDRRLSGLLDYIRQYSYSLEGKYGGYSYCIPLENILYIDSVEGRSFLYTGKMVYESKETLRDLEQKLGKTPFVRISKNCIMNTCVLKCVSPLWNHRLEAVLTSGEKLIVGRKYIGELKEKLARQEGLL